MRFTFVYGSDTPFLRLDYRKAAPVRYPNFPPPPLDMPGYIVSYRMNAYGGMYEELRCNRCRRVWEPAGHSCASDQPTGDE
jgi:hypothetical protein